MASLDEDRRTGPGRLNDGIRERTGGSGTIMWVVAAIVLALLAWWLMAGPSADTTGVTRTSPVTTTAPTNTAPNTTAPTTTPKQP